MSTNLKKQDRDMILALVTHDLKTPINASIMAINLLKNKNMSPLNNFQKEILDDIMGSMKFSKNLVENILYKYKIENNVYFLNKTSVNFVDFANTVIETSKYILRDKNQTLHIIKDINNPFISIDTVEITRVINNLFSNASKYSPQKAKITIRLFDNTDYIFFSIENPSGKIVNPVEIFEKFVTNSDKTKTLSLGLGLYIVKKIVQAHGGKVFAESDKTIRITFSLPK